MLTKEEAEKLKQDIDNMTEKPVEPNKHRHEALYKGNEMEEMTAGIAAWKQVLGIRD